MHIEIYYIHITHFVCPLFSIVSTKKNVFGSQRYMCSIIIAIISREYVETVIPLLQATEKKCNYPEHSTKNGLLKILQSTVRQKNCVVGTALLCVNTSLTISLTTVRNGAPFL
jgi:hypothetical protein